MNFVLPSKSQVGYLDPEISGEGQKVILSDGEQVSWTPPPARPVMPDWSQIKSIARYFGRTGHQVYPAWLYHPTEDARLVKNADEAGELGVCYREATQDERGRYGLKAVWDWREDCQWRPQPYPGTMKFDPLKPGQGKTFQPAQQNPATAQHQLLEALIPAVAAAVAQSLKSTGPGAPANIDAKQWEAFLQFQAFQKAAEAVDIVKQETAQQHDGGGDGAPEPAANALNAGAPAPAVEPDRAELLAEAESKGVKVDKRWSLATLQAEIEKAA